MSKPFATTLAFEYLVKVGLEEGDALYLAQENVSSVNEFLDDAISFIGETLLETDTCIGEDHKRRFELYSLISQHFFQYGYARFWVFKSPQETFPKSVDQSLFETGVNFSDCLAKIIDTTKLDTEFLRHLDIQVRQWIYVYCFENGHNFNFY
jgi:hypothetical protein